MLSRVTWCTLGALLLPLASPHALLSQALETETARLLAPGRVVLGTNVEYQFSSEGRESALPASFEVGLAKRWELLIEPVAYTAIRPRVGSRVTGAGDLEGTLTYLAGHETAGRPAIALPAAPAAFVVTAAIDTSHHALVTRRQLGIAGGAVLVTALVLPLDGTIQAVFQHEDIQGLRTGHQLASGLAFAGGPGPFVAGGALVLGGLLLHRDGTAALGLHLTEAVVLAAAIDGLGKGLSGRALPNAPSHQEPGEFSLGRGFHENNGPFVSFPSGHTAAGFAVAAVLAGETALAHPRLARYIVPVAYTGAALIGIARLYQNVHWASDLPLAAVIGIWSGHTIVRLTHRRDDGRLTRWLRGAAIVPNARGRLMVTWSSRTQTP